MNPYSHIVVASQLEALVRPENPPEYYWGAVAPDIRYLAAIKRRQTHIPPEQIVAYNARYPHLKSFLQGYLVHCLSDEIELGEVFFRHFPFSMLRDKISRQQIAIVLEQFYFEIERVNQELSDSHNEVLDELGLTAALSTKFSQSVSQYALSPSVESRLTDLFRILGLENDSRIEKYMAANANFQKNRILKNALFFRIRTGNINAHLVSMTAALYRQWEM